MERSLWAVGVGVVALLASACQPAEGPETAGEEVGRAHQAQIPINPDKDFRHYWAEINENPVIDILVIGASDIGKLERNTEYWFVQTGALADLGEDDLVWGYADGDGTPPSLSGDQEFTQPVYLTWERFHSDPVSGGELHSKGDHHVRIGVTGGEISRITWYQILPHQNPQNVAPEGEYVPASGSVSIPSGYYGYSIDATIE